MKRSLFIRAICFDIKLNTLFIYFSARSIIDTLSSGIDLERNEEQFTAMNKCLSLTVFFFFSGSIMVDFNVNGMDEDVDEVVAEIYSLVSSGLSVRHFIHFP